MLSFAFKGAASKDYNIMRPTTFDPSALRRHLRRYKIADLLELKLVLGTDTEGYVAP